MKNLKFSVPGQMLLMAKTHLTTSFLFMILFLLTLSMAGKTRDIVFGLFGTIGYFLSIYSAAGSAYLDDKKSISPLTPKATKGLVLPVILTVISLLLIIIYKFAWSYGANGGYLLPWAVPLNILFLLWVAPYQTFLGLANGSIALYGYLIIFLTPFIASFLGYLAAFCGFDLNAKVHGIAYEKKKDKNEF